MPRSLPTASSDCAAPTASVVHLTPHPERSSVLLLAFVGRLSPGAIPFSPRGRRPPERRTGGRPPPTDFLSVEYQPRMLAIPDASADRFPSHDLSPHRFP